MNRMDCPTCGKWMFVRMVDIPFGAPLVYFECETCGVPAQHKPIITSTKARTNIICKWRGHRWFNTSSVQTVREKGKYKDVWEKSRLCTRCGVTEIIGTEPYIEGVTKR